MCMLCALLHTIAPHGTTVYTPLTGKLHFSIHTLPDVLILHLQRLVMSANGGGKIRTLVRFPLSQLDMQPFTTGRVHKCDTPWR